MQKGVHKIHRKTQNSQENTLIKLLKKRLWCFAVNVMKFLRTSFFTEQLWTTASTIGMGVFSNNRYQSVFKHFTFVLKRHLFQSSFGCLLSANN